jgi:hypothetical protein
MTFQSPNFTPSRERASESRCGALVIDSMPPATTMSNSPARINWSARAIASRPDRHTLLIVRAGHVHADPGIDRGLAGGDLAGACLQHVAHDHVVDLLRRRHARTLKRGLDGHSSEVCGR